MADIIQQLLDLKEWSQNPERYERRLAFREQHFPPSPEAGTIPIEFDELSPQEQEYYQQPPFSTDEIFLGSKGGVSQLVQPGPGRQGYGGPSVYTINEENFKLLDDWIPNTKLTINEIKVKLGGKAGTGNQGINKLMDAWAASNKDRVVSEGRFRPYKLEGTELAKKIIDATKDAKYIKEDGTPNIKRIAKEFFSDRKLDDGRKAVRKILEGGIDYKGKANIEGEITSAEKSKKKALEDIKIATTKAGGETTKQADQVIDKIVSQNEIYQKMSVEDIAKDKNLLKRLRVQIDPVTGVVDYNGYTKLDVNKKTVMTDLELAQHAKNKADTYQLFTHDHITPKTLRRQNVGYPINFQATTYMENSHLDNARKYLLKNPDGANVIGINNYLNERNLTIRGKDFITKNNPLGRHGYQEAIEYIPERGTNTIVESSFKKTVPKIVRPKFVSFPANFADVKLSKVVKGWRGGVLFEIIVGVLDYWDQQSKGKEGGWMGQAMTNAIQTASFGILKTGDKKYVYELLKLGKEMGFDTTALEHVIDINKRDNVLAKVQEKHAAQLESFQKALDEETNPEVKEKQQEYFNDLKIRFATEERLRAEETNKIFDTYIEDLRATKAGPVQLVSPEKLAATDITQEEADLPFESLWTTAVEQLRKEKTKVFPEASKRLDYEAGFIGDPLQTYLFNLPAWSAEHKVWGLWNKTPKQEERAYLDSLIKLAEAGNPQPLKEYNERRDVYEDQPITTQSLKNLTEQHPWLGYRIEEAEGGIASLLKK